MHYTIPNRRYRHFSPFIIAHHKSFISSVFIYACRKIIMELVQILLQPILKFM